MRRRQLLGMAAGTIGCGLAGCTLPGEGDRHPFAGKTVGVHVVDDSETDHDVHRNAWDALDFWEDRAPEYVGFRVTFESVSADRADLRIRYVDEPSDCRGVENYSELVLGCAPILRPGSRVSRPVTAIVVASTRPFGKIRITTKHEIGHVLGLYHDDEPQEIMSNRPEARIPSYALRVEIWESTMEANRQAASATKSFNDGVSFWRDGSYELASQSFTTARDEYTSSRRRLERARSSGDEFTADDRVETVDLGRLDELLSQFESRMALGESFADSMRQSAVAAASDDFERAESHRSAANESLEAYRNGPSPELRDVAIALGLVRGFDLDEPMGPVDEDVIES
ncbi:matrixin family metalloprotease [Halovivax gelatinilyticus]|uniref:matrixin family metalloprotease n=1 Tax=Halovivax gelatinilyticus TaxID=2961597 RepID=UPI0020CA71DF|nr:matrixin family metalloprotease [Halovivax gelatinilyticus]